MNHDCYDIDCHTDRHNRVSASEKNKFISYRDINPLFELHNVYRRKRDYIPEHYRIAFTRMRLSSHRLRIETGRWARLPREQRLCRCGLVKDEMHVLTDCPLVNHIRDAYGQDMNYPYMLTYVNDKQDCVYIHETLCVFHSTCV